MGKVRGFLLLFATLFLFWVMLMDSLSSDVLIVGAVASLFIAYIYPDGLSFSPSFAPPPRPS